jgi:hypothetical protein
MIGASALPPSASYLNNKNTMAFLRQISILVSILLRGLDEHIYENDIERIEDNWPDERAWTSTTMIEGRWSGSIDVTSAL